MSSYVVVVVVVVRVVVNEGYSDGDSGLRA